MSRCGRGSLDGRLGCGRLAGRIIEKQLDVIMQCALVAFQRQRIVAALIDDLLSDRALAVECIGGHDRAFQRQHLQQLRHSGDLVRLGIRSDLRQHQTLFAAPGADHVQRRLAAGAIERTAQHLAVDRDNALTVAGELRHEALKRCPELLRIKPAKQPAEGVVAGQTIGKLEETPQEGLFRPGIQPHVDRALATTQHAAQGNHQHLVEVMQGGIPGSRVIQLLPARGKLFQSDLPRCDTSHPSVELIVSAPGKPRTICQWGFKCDSPGIEHGQGLDSRC